MLFSHCFSFSSLVSKHNRITEEEGWAAPVYSVSHSSIPLCAVDKRKKLRRLCFIPSWIQRQELVVCTLFCPHLCILWEWTPLLTFFHASLSFSLFESSWKNCSRRSFKIEGYWRQNHHACSEGTDLRGTFPLFCNWSFSRSRRAILSAFWSLWRAILNIQRSLYVLVWNPGWCNRFNATPLLTMRWTMISLTSNRLFCFMSIALVFVLI